MSTSQATPKPRKARARPELSIFEEELNVPFNKKEFLPDLPPHARGQVATPSPSAPNGEEPPEVQVQVVPIAADPLGVRPVHPAAGAHVPSPTSRKKAPDTTQEVRTNLGQTQDEVRAEPRTNFGSTSDKVRTCAPTEPLVQKETTDKPRAQPRTEVRTNLGQTSDKVRTPSGFFELVGLQRQIVLFLHEQSKLARDRVTDPIAIAVVATSCGTTVLSAQKTIQRLEGKGLIRRVSFRNGRGGWTRYEVAHKVFQEILHLESQDKLRTNLGQTSDELRAQPRTQPRTSASSSSSSVVLESLKTTTTGEDELFDDGRVQLAPEWAAVDFAGLADVGFSRAHLVQLAKHGKLSAAEVQDSIHFFAFDLKRNEKGREIKGPAVNFFMGILRKGQPYAPPANYESPEETARRKYLEGKRRLEERRQAEERELQDLGFVEWRRGVSPEEVNAIVPEVVRQIPRASESSLRAYFDESVWPARRAAVPGAAQRERAEIARQVEQSLAEAKV